MVTIDLNTAKDMYFLNLMYELHKISEKLKFFENKYQKSYEAFEKEIKNAKEEDFEKWDNYLEWKAYKKIQSKYYEEKEDIENGNFKIKIV